MKYMLKALSVFTALMLMASSLPVSAAPTYTPRTGFWDKDADGNEIWGFDGQAYTASRYVPSLTPQVVVGALVIIAVLVVYLQNRESVSDHGHN